MLAMNPILHLWLHRSFNPLLPGTFRITLVGGFLSLLGSAIYYIFIGIGKARETAYSTGIQFIANAVILMTFVFFFARITVAEAAIAFSIAQLSSTIYLRLRIYFVYRSREVLTGKVALDAPEGEFRI
jgi:O-antigen/teichoic acid export membrane protein